MATILDTILSEKKIEVDQLKMNQTRLDEENIHTPRSFVSILEKADKLTIISEFKRSSPSKGEINSSLDPVEQTTSYVKYGASAVSVLTDHRFFNGSISDLKEVRNAIDVPILCKDFIIDSIQIDVAKNAGADIILLIVAAMDEKKLVDLYQYAKNQQLEVLMEVHSEDELKIALKTGAKLIGVNNRNLKTFEVDLGVTEKLAPIVKKSGAFLISESGIKTIDDVKRVMKAGANAILVGEMLMRAEDLPSTLQEMQLPLQKGERI
jgi:indole-3-glycerol phosphate synthase